jgi:flagellar assembly protein FliH
MNGTTAWERWELASLDAEPPPPPVLSSEDTQPSQPDRDEIERICAEAKQEGYEDGYAAGQAAARQEAARLANAADVFEKALAEFDQQVADELLALAIEIARQVVRAEIAAHPDHVIAVLHQALAQLPHQHAIIYLNPDDASLVRSYAGDQLTHAGHRILEDAKLKPGDCVLESGNSQIDATLATRWRRVIESVGFADAWNGTETK